MTRHTRMMIAIVALGIVGILTASMLTAAADPQGKSTGTLVINLTSGKEDLHAVTMALQLANHGLDDGREVTIFANVRAPELLVKNQQQTPVFGDNPPVPTMLTELMKRGATVLVCPACMKVMNVTPETLMPGVHQATRASLFGKLGAGAQVFSY